MRSWATLPWERAGSGMSDVPAGLAAATAVVRPEWADASLMPLRDTGLAHLHVELVGTGVLARIPKQSQLDLGVEENLAHQAACFDRAAASGHTPALHAVLPPRAGLPRGALLVDRVEGRPARLPGDLPAVARALAAIHALPLPNADARPPLQDDPDPVAALHREIVGQAAYLDAADLHPASRASIDAELERLAALVARPDRPRKHLISFDAHPGNFLVRADGEAVLVDLEKCRYSHPALDLAHATLYTSTTWELGSSAVLVVDEVRSAYAEWERVFEVVGGSADVGWQVPLRRAMQLWSLTWCAKWRVMSARDADTDLSGEDWAVELSADDLAAHVRERVDHYLDPATVTRLAADLDALEAA